MTTTRSTSHGRGRRRVVQRQRIQKRGRNYPEQSDRQRERAKRYVNRTNPLTGFVTSGLLPGRDRPKAPAA